ncbi:MULTISPECIES: hypothetical protein [Comamonas]|jgi:hypothetical protein|uniref:hypothetical protein n=1 Tax=Comamonas TaxID=283 RepID=UPI0017850073|nr:MULTISPECIES: hypothetical protein [Comamonas]
MIQTYPCISARNPALWHQRSASAGLMPDESMPLKHGLPAWQVVNESIIVTIGYMAVNA